MSVPTRSPLRMAGAILNSGGLNTGEVNFADGGERTYWSASGVAADTLIQSGAGRLNVVTQLTQLASGRAVIFYDSAIATSGGPFSASGHKALFTIQPTFSPGVWSGVAPRADWNLPQKPQMAFQSGLVAAPVVNSGTCSFAVGYTLETNNNQ